MQINSIDHAFSLIGAGNFQDALPILQDLHAGDAANPRVNYGLGLAFLFFDQPERAVPFLTVAAKAAKKEAAVHATLANALNIDHRSADALPHARKGAALDRKSEYAHRVLGEVYSDLRRPVMARQAFEQALKADPGSARSHLGLFELEMTLGNLEAAEAHIRTAVERAPDDPAILAAAANALDPDFKTAVLASIERLLAGVPEGAATPDVTGSVCNRYVFRISVNLPQNVKAAAMLAAGTDAKTWTTIGPDYAFGHQSWEYFEKYLQAMKPNANFLPKDAVAFPPFKTTDFNPYINKIMQSGADGVLVSLWGGNLIDFVRQAQEMGLFDGKRQVLMTLGAATEVLSALGDKMPEGLWVGTRYWFLANDSQRNQDFVKAYFDRYGEYPSYNAHGEYGALYTYKAAAEKAGGIDKEKVIDALEGLTVELPVGEITIRPEDHQALSDVSWGQTAAHANYPIRILNPVKIFKAGDVTPSPADSGCRK